MLREYRLTVKATADDESPSGFVSSRGRRRFVQKADITMWVQCMLIIYGDCVTIKTEIIDHAISFGIYDL